MPWRTAPAWPGKAAAGNRCDDVELAVTGSGDDRLLKDHLQHRTTEIFGEILAIDGDLSSAGLHPYAGDGVLALAGGIGAAEVVDLALVNRSGGGCFSGRGVAKRLQIGQIGHYALLTFFLLSLATSSTSGCWGFMGVVSAGIDAQVLHLAAAKRTARNHALDSLFDDAFRETALDDLARSAFLDAAGIAGVPVVDLVGVLLAGHRDLVGIDDDDIVAVVNMRGVGGFMLAAQAHGDERSETAEGRDPRHRSRSTSFPPLRASGRR